MSAPATRPGRAARYRQAAELSRRTADARRCWPAPRSGMQSLGHRSGAQNAEVLELLREADRRLDGAAGPLTALRSRVLAALARALRHGSVRPAPDRRRLAARATGPSQLASAAGDPHALGHRQLAVHDAMWAPGTAARAAAGRRRDARRRARRGDADLVAEAHLLRAAALLELGDPAGRDELSPTSRWPTASATPAAGGAR